MLARLRSLRWLLAAGAVLATALIVGCGAFLSLPGPTTVEDRLAALPLDGAPLERPVTIRWNEHLVPFVEAQTDRDLAVALGIVHAHLRLGQMALVKRVAQGRISESAGPLTRDLDHALRALNLGRAAAEMEAALPSDTRAWLEGFAAGINHVQARSPLPHEYAALAFEPEPWTVEDLLTVGRLLGVDVSWGTWLQMLPLRDRPEFAALHRELQALGRGAAPATGIVPPLRSPPEPIEPVSRAASPPAPTHHQPGGSDDRALRAFARVLSALAVRGSNSVVVSGARTRSGAALMANDPHLGLILPNFWLVVGARSPSYHLVGLMPSGLPFWGLGRNADIAWGGTNMRSTSSNLVDVSGLPPDAFTERTVTIAARGWPDTERTIRESPHGPVLTDLPILRERLGDDPPDIALSWLGHEPSDEFSAFLAINRARDFDGFRAALRGYRVSGQNLLYADRQGHIGHALAVSVPNIAPSPTAGFVRQPEVAARSLMPAVGADQLPARFDPPEGFIASANNNPIPARARVGDFFSDEARVDRMGALLEAGAVDLEALRALQQDVYNPISHRLASVLAALAGSSAEAPRARRIVGAMAGWDGHYRAAAVGPAAFELVLAAFEPRFYADRYPPEVRAVARQVGNYRTRLLADVEAAAADEGARAQAAERVRDAVLEAADRLGETETWGDLHEVRVAHPLGMVPLLGERWPMVRYPADGSTDTLLKTAHGPVEGPHRATYGAQARHLSDLADPDANYVVLLGGQDGWLNSAAYSDQIPLWRSGRLMHLPLTQAAVRRAFPRVTVVEPPG